MKKGWEYNTLGMICKIYNGNSINADYKKKHYMGLTKGYPFIATKDVSFDGTINYENGVKIPFDEGLKVAKPSSVFICVEGGSAGRKTGLVDRDVCFGNKLFCLESKGSVLGPFIYYYLKSGLFQQQFAERLTGLIGGVSAKKFNDISIIYPSLSEQQSIVEYLDSSFAKIDTLKANAAKNLDEAKTLFQSALKEALEPKKGWKEKTLKEVSLSITDGDHMPPPKANEGIPFITISNIDKETNTLNMEDTFYVPEDYYNSLKEDRKPQIGDLLYTVTGSFGIPVVVESDKRFCFQRHIAMIRPDKAQVLCKYLYYWCLSPNAKSEADKVATGTAQRTVSLTSLRKFIIPVPSIKEQEMLISYLYSLERKVNTLQQNYSRICSECDALKRAILKQVFE